MKRLARLLLYAGVVAAVLVLAKVHAAYVAEPPYVWHESSRFAWSLAYAAVLSLTAYGVGLPDLPRGSRSAIVNSVVAVTVGALGISVIQLVVGDALLPRFVVFGAALLLIPWYLFTIAVATGGRTQAESRDRICVVADRAEVATLEDDLQVEPERAAQVVSVLAPAEARSGSGASKSPLIEAVSNSRATLVVLSRDAQTDEDVVAQAALLHEEGVRIRTLSMFYEQWLGKLPLSELERVSLMFDIGEIHRVRYGRAKRMIDLCLATLGCVVGVLVIPVVLVGNLLANRGPLFYSQLRVGKNGAPFTILKFRTMRGGTQGAVEGEWTREGDSRVTSFGRLLRASHVDELPQMINVLRGELSIVGPRPEQPQYVAELATKLPFYELRHLVRPGITGWAQVKYGYAGDETDAMEKLQYEFYYLRHQSLALDARILGRTLRSVLRREGR